MVTKFTRKELQRLKCTEDEINLIMLYQKKLPILIENEEVDGFCVDVRELHFQLGVGKHFADWFKIRVKAYGFIENIDFTMVSPIGETKGFAVGGDTRSKNYLLTIGMAENLALVEKTTTGQTVREYFRLMRTIVKRHKNWTDVRNPERKEYNDMCTMLSNNIFKHNARPADKYDYAREANIMNIIATGSEAQSIRNYFGINNNNELTRDSLEQDYNEKLAFLQKQNMIYLGLDMPIVERVKMLIASFDVIYPIASPILPYLSRDDMLKARESLINKLSV